MEVDVESERDGHLPFRVLEVEMEGKKRDT